MSNTREREWGFESLRPLAEEEEARRKQAERARSDDNKRFLIRRTEEERALKRASRSNLLPQIKEVCQELARATKGHFTKYDKTGWGSGNMHPGPVPSLGGDHFCILYGSRDIDKSVKPITVDWDAGSDDIQIRGPWGEARHISPKNFTQKDLAVKLDEAYRDRVGRGLEEGTTC